MCLFPVFLFSFGKCCYLRVSQFQCDLTAPSVKDSHIYEDQRHCLYKDRGTSLSLLTVVMRTTVMVSTAQKPLPCQHYHNSRNRHHSHKDRSRMNSSCPDKLMKDISIIRVRIEAIRAYRLLTIDGSRPLIIEPIT